MSLALSLSILLFVVGFILGSLVTYRKAWNTGNKVGYQWGRDDGKDIEIRNIKKRELLRRD